jgi:hypothetical protein
MYRKIQFKGKRIDNGKDVVGFFLGVNPVDSDVTFLGLSGGIDYRVHSNSVGQFTGLNTGRKEDLFEGDIFNYSKHKGYIYDDFQGEIAFQEGCFGFKIITGQVYREFTPFSEIDELQIDFLNHIEIVGRCGS